MTNREYLESLDDTDLAEELCDMRSCDTCKGAKFCVKDAGHGNGLRKWLKQEADDGQTVRD